jgi:hypothetical protein
LRLRFREPQLEHQFIQSYRNSARLWVFGTRAWRTTQAMALESLLPSGNLVLGADLNTWLGPEESSARHFLHLFAEIHRSCA